MDHDPRLSDRKDALRAVLVQRANDSRPSRRATIGGPGESTARRLPTLVTGVVLVAVVAISAAAIAAGQSRTTAAVEAPAAPAPIETARVTATPSPSPTLSSTSSGTLIAMDRARTLTRTQLHEWTLANTDDSSNARIGEEQDWLKIQCMAQHGYLYDPTFDGSQGLERGKTWGLTSKQLQGYRTALWGENLTSSKPYDWHNAGCDGLAVHLTGQDNNH